MAATGGRITPAGSGGAVVGGATGGAPTGGAETGGASGGNGGTAGGAGGKDTGPAAGGGAGGRGGVGGVTRSGGAPGGAGGIAVTSIPWGTTLDAQTQIKVSRQLASSLVNPSSAQWRAKGDQHRTYHFAEANADVPYRLCVPTTWDGQSKVPLVMFLHGAGNDESSYLDQNNKQMVKLAEQHGVILVSPLGYQGAYGTFLKLPATFGQPAEAAKLIAAVTPQTEKTQELSEKDVINVLELVLAEYPIDSSKVYLTGHSMGSGGTWYIGAKYADYWAALAPMSGPFVTETGYPWDHLRRMPIFVTEGTRAATLDASRALRTWMTSQGFQVQYKEVDADHPGMVPLVLPDVFDFFAAH